MKALKKYAVFLLALALVFALTACGSTGTQTNAGGDGGESGSVVYRTLDEIKSSGTVNIGVFSDKNPFGYVDENGNYAGYDVYFAERIGQDAYCGAQRQLMRS